MKLLHVAAALLTLISAQVFSAEETNSDKTTKQGWMWGVGLGVSQDIYKGYDQRIIPLPLIGYQGERLSVIGPFVRYKVADYSGLSFNLLLSPRFAGYDESDSDVFEGMADRDFSLDVGAGISMHKDDWKLETQLLVDALGRSNGYEAKTRFSKKWNYGPIFFEPTLELSYWDANLVDYYYGVRDDERTAFRSAYHAGDSLNSSIDLSVFTPIFAGGMTRLSLKHSWYGSSMRDSPLTDKDTSWSMFISFSKFF